MWVVKITPGPLYTQEQTPVPIESLCKAGWDPGVLGNRNIIVSGIQTPDPPLQNLVAKPSVLSQFQKIGWLLNGEFESVWK